MNLIDLKGIKKTYLLGHEGAGPHASTHCRRGEFTVVTGPSGSGKTTLLNIIGCLTGPPRAGTGSTASMS